MSSSLQSLQSLLKGSVTTENDADYDISRWAKNAVRRAKYVVYPKDAEDVSKIIQYAKAEKLDLAVRGGGHSTSGASSSEGGLVIHLGKNMNGVRVDAERKLAYVQGGALWETLDAEAIKHGLAGAAGIVNHTGVGGLTLGGGLGYKIGTHGLVIDNLRGAKVVVASGEILTANEQENADLFWAIRGGGGNFGVVTEFIFELHEQRPDVYSSVLIFPPPALPAVVKELQEWLKTQSPNESVFIGFSSGPDGSPMIMVVCVKNSSEAEGVASFKRFVGIGPVVNASKQIPYVELNQLMNPKSSHGANRLHSGVRGPAVDLDLLQRVFDARLKLVTEHPETAKSIVAWEFYHYDKVASVPVEATAFSDRNRNINSLLGLTWESDSFGAIAKEEARKITRAMVSGASEVDEGQIGYRNYGDVEALNAPEDRSKNVYGVNYPRLQQIKKKYDPDMLFNKWFPIRPAA